MAQRTRDRMIDAAVLALKERGLAGMSFTDVLAASGAARGAIYHHFPGGKRQLVAEAATRSGSEVHAQLGMLPTVSPEVVVDAFLTGARMVAEAATMGMGCAIAAVAMEHDADGGELSRVADTVFRSWTDQLAGAMTTAGLPAELAADRASLLIALLEGAQVLCRASGNLEPFDRAARAARSLWGVS